MESDPNPHLRQVILEIVDNQLRDNNPPETRETLERLIAEGLPRNEAVRLIACVVATEIFEVLKSNLPYNNARFVAALKELPRLQSENDTA